MTGLLIYDSRVNNFDFIRLTASVFVIFTHAFDIPGLEEKEPLRIISGNSLSFSYLGLCAFFLLSGFLITQSWLRSKSLKEYFQKRALRIFPALIGVIVCTIFLYGPFLTSLPLSVYFTHPETYAYLKNVLIFQAQSLLPGVYESVPVASINGSLWTLPYELLFYILLPFLGRNLFQRRNLIFLGLLLLCVAGYWMLKHPEFAGLYSPKVNMFRGSLVHFGVLWVTGSLFYLFQEHIPFCKSYFYMLVFLYAIIVYYGSYDMVQVLSPPIFGYLLFCVAFWPGLLPKIGKYGDFSYGMYIYGYPIQMLLLYHFAFQNIYWSFFLTLIIVFPLAWASWWGVEYPSLMRRRKGEVKSAVRG